MDPRARVGAGRRHWPFLAFFLVFLLAVPAAAQIQVNSASPSTADQGTINLNVTVGGKGFKRGAKANFFLSGTQNPDGILVNSTTFVSSVEVVANINVADTATIAKFDIQVQNSDGRIGKGTELFSVLAKGSTSATPQAIVRASFAAANANNVPYALRSDGLYQPCGWDYVDKTDTCTGLGLPNDVQADASNMLTGDTSWLRTVVQCCSGDAIWDNWVYTPTRWIVLDFTNSGGGCPNLDQTIANHASANGSAAHPPLNADPCVDFVEIRFKADRVFSKNTKSTSVSLNIDEPQLQVLTGGGTRTQWNTIYFLQYEKAVSVIHNLDGTVTLTTGSKATAQLLDANTNAVLGTYNMPFSITMKQVP